MPSMEKLILSAGGLALVLGCSLAFSQNQDAPPDQASQGSLAGAKQRMAQRIQDRIGKLQQSLDCIHNAQDKASLRACMPELGNRDGGGTGMRRGDWGGSGNEDGGSGN